MIFVDEKIPVIKTDATQVTGDVVNKLILKHKKFRHRYKKNWDYYVGRHEIQNKTYADTSKPCNKIVLEIPQYIVAIKTGMMSGEPISLTSEDSEQLKVMNEILSYNDFHNLFSELDEISWVYGQAYTVTYINSEGKIAIKPQTPETTFVVYDTTLDEKEKFGILYYDYVDEVTNDAKRKVDVYDDSYHYIFEGDLDKIELVNVEEHYFGRVPVTEFYNYSNRRGGFENVISIIDGLESIISDNIDTIDYFSDSYLMLKNLSGTTEEDILTMKKNRVMLVEEDGEAKFISPTINDNFNHNTIKTLEENLYMIAKVPRLSDSSFSSNSSGTALSYKLFGCEKDIDIKQNNFEMSFKKVFRLINELLNKKGYDFDVDKLHQVYTISLPNDMVSLADAVSKLRGTVSQETLISQLNFISSPALEMEKFRAEQDYNMKQMDIYDDLSTQQNEVDVNEEQQE